MFEEGQGSMCGRGYFAQGENDLALENAKQNSEQFELIAVTDRASCSRSLGVQVERICNCEYKPSMLILRAKELSESEYEALAKQVLPICREHGVELVLHTHWQLALELGLSAVQLPLPLLESLHTCGRNIKLNISTSVHSLAEAQQALELGATALIAGHIYATDCKRGLAPRGVEFLRSICSTSKAFAQANTLWQIPVYAIGGIKFNSVQWEELKNAGSSGACIMSGYMKI